VVTVALGSTLSAVPLSESVALADEDAAAIVPETDGGLSAVRDAGGEQDATVLRGLDRAGTSRAEPGVVRRPGALRLHRRLGDPVLLPVCCLRPAQDRGYPRTPAIVGGRRSDRRRSPLSHERSHQEEDALRRSLRSSPRRRPCRWWPGPPAAAQIPDALPTLLREALREGRPATLAELDAACQRGRHPACAEATKMRAEILSSGFLVRDPPPMATGGGGALSKVRPEPPAPPPSNLMPGP
jgi:hypothetical protein